MNPEFMLSQKLFVKLLKISFFGEQKGYLVPKMVEVCFFVFGNSVSCLLTVSVCLRCLGFDTLWLVLLVVEFHKP